MVKRHRPRFWLGWLALGMLGGCAPVALPEPDPELRLEPADLAMARQAYANLLEKFPAYADASVTARVRAVGERLVAGVSLPANSKLQFTVLDSPGIFAHSLADGKIVVSRGLLVILNSEAQLAAVLAHEIGHIVGLHQVRYQREAIHMRRLEMRLAARLDRAEARDALSAMGLARMRGYSREQELDADAWSERLLERAGYDAGAMAQVVRLFIQHESYWDRSGFELWEIPETAGDQGVFATHPNLAHRMAQAVARQGRAAQNPARPDPAYLRLLQDMPYNLSVRWGIQRGRQYVHPEARLGMTVPPAWYFFGARDRLVVAPRGRDGLLIIEFTTAKDGESRRQALERLARDYTLEAVTVIARAETAAGWKMIGAERRQTRFAVVDAGTRRLQIAGYTYKPDHWREADGQFQEIVKSIRTLPEAEARRARPPRVKIAEAGAVAHAPSAQSYGDHPFQRWQLLNQIYPDGRPPAGQAYKIVE